MEIKYFGQYLIEKGIIRKEDLLQAMKIQEKTNLTLCEMALQEGLISRESYDRILDYQIKYNSNFMNAASRLNLIPPHKVEELVSKQISNNVLFGDALVKAGILSREETDRHFRNFRTEQSVLEFKILNAIASHRHSPIIEVIIQSTINLFRYLLDISPRIGGFYVDSRYPVEFDWYTFEEMTGDSSFLMELYLKEDIMLKISSALMKQKMEKIDEIVLDSSREFLNIAGGYACTALSLKNIRCEPSVPEIKKVTEIDSFPEKLRVPFLLPSGTLELKVLFRDPHE